MQCAFAWTVALLLSSIGKLWKCFLRFRLQESGAPLQLLFLFLENVPSPNMTVLMLIVVFPTKKNISLQPASMGWELLPSLFPRVVRKLRLAVNIYCYIVIYHYYIAVLWENTSISPNIVTTDPLAFRRTARRHLRVVCSKTRMQAPIAAHA